MTTFPSVAVGPDVEVIPGGSIWTFRPRTPLGEAWIANNVTAPTWAWWGGALCVEHRYAADLMRGMTDDGLEVGN